MYKIAHIPLHPLYEDPNLLHTPNKTNLVGTSIWSFTYKPLNISTIVTLSLFFSKLEKLLPSSLLNAGKKSL